MQLTMIIDAGAKPAFELGQCCASSGVVELVGTDLRMNADMVQCFARHALCDWGDMPPEDCEGNLRSLEHGGRLMSCYTLCGETVWIFTEADRSVTTILLPDEY